jgi:hypothetical protein
MTWRVRTAAVAAFVLGVVALGLGAGSVVLDRLTHQPGTGGPAVDAFVGAVDVVPSIAVGILLASSAGWSPTR